MDQLKFIQKMKSYRKLIRLSTLGILGCLMLVLNTSCKVFKSNSNMISVEEASFYKTFGGQGRSRNINFEISTKESLALMDALYALEVDGFNIDLKVHQEGDKSKLLGYYTEYRQSREIDFDKDGLFNKIPFSSVVLKVKQGEKVTDIDIQNLESKPTKYYP